MTSTDETVAFRPAREADHEAVMAFCATTWADGDYIPVVWDQWLADAKGALLVAEVAGEPVALGHLAMVNADEGWIEGIRVAESARGNGIGGGMVRALVAAARERHATVARSFTEEANAVARALFVRQGFSLVAELVRYTGEPLAEAPDALSVVRTPGPDDLPRLWDWLEQSNLTPMNGGLTFSFWAGQAMTESLLAAALAAGEVTTLEDFGAVAALSVAAPYEVAGDRYLEVRYIDGQADGLSRLGQALRARAHTQGLARVELWLPDALILRDAMDGAGFTRRDLMVVYAHEF